MGIIRKVHEGVLRLLGATHLEIELRRLRANMNRDDQRLQEMELAADGDCCPGCKFGWQYNDLLDKQARRREWEQVLQKKISARAASKVPT